MRRLSPPVAAAFCLIAVVPATGAAQNASRTLFDQLPAVGVHVVGITPAIDSVGIDSLSLRLSVETRLQREGLSTPGRGQLLTRQETPRLVARLAALPVDSAYFYTVSLELVEPVRLERNGLTVLAYGWSKQVVGVADRALVREAIEGAVDQLAVLFLEGRRRALSLAIR
jgi:hypothetical protein